MNIDDAAAQLAQTIAASQGRTEAITRDAHDAHSKALAAADAAHSRAVRVADATLAETVDKTQRACVDGIARAYAKFDISARNALSLPEGATVKDVGTARMEARLTPDAPPVAVAAYTGPSGWTVDGPDGRVFLAPDQRIRARTMLWTIAATAPVPQ